jgi:tol-pal system protein YbgF
MRRPLALLIVVGAAFLLSACATRGSVRDVGARVDQVAKDLAALRGQQDNAARESAMLTLELRSSGGRLRDTEARLRDTMDRVAALGNRIAATEASLREVIATVDALPRQSAAQPPASVVPERALGRESSVAAEQAFASALRTFRSGEHGQAVLELTDFVGRYPNHSLAARAQLWIGEAYFRERDYRQALLEYRKAVDVSPEPTAAADAWLKIGQAYAALRDRPAAAEAWQRVMREYPETEAAGQARSLLRR